MLSEEQLKAAYNGCKEGGHLGALAAVAEAAVKDAGGGEVFGYVDSHPDHGHEFSKSKQALYPADIAEGWTQITVYERPQASQLNLDYLREMGRLEARIRELEQASAAVPEEPTEAMWSGLARDLMMWLDFERKTPRALFTHLEMLGREIPQWLRDEPEMKALDHVPSKGTRAVLIYRAMLAASQPEVKP